jgi:hypothetical protein
MHLAFETPSKIDKYQVVVEVLSGWLRSRPFTVIARIRLEPNTTEFRVYKPFIAVANTTFTFLADLKVVVCC